MKLKIFCLLMAITAMSSCKKFLEGRSQSEVTPETTRDYSELLFSKGYPVTWLIFQPALLYMDDDIQCYSYPQASEYYDIAEGPLGAFSWQPDFIQRMNATGLLSEDENNSYKKYYECIVGCNIAIDAADGTIGTQDEKEQLKGEALALRAFYYFNLANLYGNPYNDSSSSPEKQLAVPLMLSPGLSANMPPRNTVAEVYAQIQNDISQAITLLGKKKKMSNYRMNYLAAHLFASRIGLFTENWDQVIENATKVISDRPQLFDLNSWPVDYFPEPDNFLPICTRPNMEVLWLFSSEKDYVDEASSILYGISEDLAGKYEPDDLRNLYYINETPDFLRAWVPPKFSQNKRLAQNHYEQSGSALRVSEAYLNRAEAYAQLYIKTGNQSMAQKAIDDLNTLRQKRFSSSQFLPLDLMPAAELLQFCRDERRRELCTEGHRWFDLRRYGMPAISHIYSRKSMPDQVYKLNLRDPQYTLQIPEQSMLLNSNLIQNPAITERQPIN